MGRLRGRSALFGTASGLQAYPPHGTRASRQRRGRGAVAVAPPISGSRRVAYIYHTNAADTAASTDQKEAQLGRLAEVQHDLSRVAGLGELNGFFEVLKWK